MLRNAAVRPRQLRAGHGETRKKKRRGKARSNVRDPADRQDQSREGRSTIVQRHTGLALVATNESTLQSTPGRDATKHDAPRTGWARGRARSARERVCARGEQGWGGRGWDSPRYRATPPVPRRPLGPLPLPARAPAPFAPAEPCVGRSAATAAGPVCRSLPRSLSPRLRSPPRRSGACVGCRTSEDLCPSPPPPPRFIASPAAMGVEFTATEVRDRDSWILWSRETHPRARTSTEAPRRAAGSAMRRG